MIEMENINLIKDIAKDLEVIKKSLSSLQSKRWLTVDELSKYLGYSKDSIYKLKENELIENIHFYKKIGKILFDRVTIDDWIVGKENHDIIQSQRQIVDNIFYHLSKRYKKSLNLDDTKANRKLAQNKLIPEIQYKLNTGEFFENTKKEKVLTIDEFFQISLEIHKLNRREMTQQSYIRLYEIHIQPQFGKRRIDTIKASDLAKWQNNLSEKLASRTVKGIRTIFHTIFGDAFKDEIIKKNPFLYLRSPKKEDVRIKAPFSMEEIILILQNAHKNIKAFFALGFFTGMRTGEIIGLKWSDIDFEKKIIEVRRSRREGIESVPKTKSSIRDIEILDILLPYLQEHKKLNISNEYVFETYTGMPFNTSDKISSHYWRPLLKDLNIPYRNLYQMRHTFASMMISNSEDILWVSNMLGHKDSTTTLENYAKYVRNDNKKRAQFLEKYVA